MSQHDFDVANGSGATVRGDFNDALEALATNSSGASAPGTTYPYQWWVDSTNGQLKQRNAANSAWIVRGPLAETLLVARSSNTIIAAADYGKTFVCTSTFTQTFTAASTLGDGFWCRIRNDGVGIITLDPNSTEQIDGGLTVVLLPGESCVVICDSAGWKTVGRGGTGWKRIQTISASAAATVDFTTGISSVFDEYRVVMTDVVPGTDNTDLWFRVSQDAGSTFKAGASDYRFARNVLPDSASRADAGSAGATAIVLALALGTGTGEALAGELRISKPAGTSRYKPVHWWASYFSATPVWGSVSGDGGLVLNTSAIDGLRFLMSSGNISGDFTLFGLRR